MNWTEGTTDSGKRNVSKYSGIKKEFEKKVAKSIKTNYKHLFKYIQKRKPARKTAGLLNDNEIRTCKIGRWEGS